MWKFVSLDSYSFAKDGMFEKSLLHTLIVPGGV